jgi:4-diphosphocytidyl-2-C-methyl-D-erythritol kinase
MLARAKVNLALHVKAVRPSGYHEVETVLQSITLGDEIFMEASGESRSIIEWAPGLTGRLPDPPDIVERTIGIAHEFAEELPHAVVRIVKRIPIGAGLGGASADAAATILGLVALHRGTLRAGVIDEIASRVGVDVPFCMAGGTALGTGLGNQLKDLSWAGTLCWVLGIPKDPLSTAAVYRRFDQLGIEGTEGVDELVAALGAGDLDGVAAGMINDLEPAAFDLLPGLDGLKRAMLGAGAIGSVMTGSGSAIIGLCRDSSHARAVAAKVGQAFSRVEVVASARTGHEMQRP